MNDNNIELVLHIGYHKTGTTFFQNVLFCNHPEIAYLGRSWIDDDLNSIFYKLATEDDNDFNAGALRNEFDALVQRLIDKKTLIIQGKKVLLLSHESLHSGDSYFGFTVNRQANRIKDVFPNAKIIISIRNQSKMIESHYTNFIHHGGKMSFHKFYNKSKEFNLGLKNKLDYYQLVRIYTDLFGENNNFVLVFEDVFKDNNLSRFYEFVGIEPFVVNKTEVVNKRLSKFSIKIIRTVNTLLIRNFNSNYKNRLAENHSMTEKFRWQIIRLLKYLERILGSTNNKSSGYLSKEQKKEIMDYYESSNKKLSALIGFNLKEYGY